MGKKKRTMDRLHWQRNLLNHTTLLCTAVLTALLLKPGLKKTILLDGIF